VYFLFLVRSYLTLEANEAEGELVELKGGSRRAMFRRRFLYRGGRRKTPWDFDFATEGGMLVNAEDTESALSMEA